MQRRWWLFALPPIATSATVVAGVACGELDWAPWWLPWSIIGPGSIFAGATAALAVRIRFDDVIRNSIFVECAVNVFFCLSIAAAFSLTLGQLLLAR